MPIQIPPATDATDATDATELAPPRRRLGWRSLQVAALLLAPVVAVWAYGIERFYQLSGADPFIYTGYTFSTADLIERWGYPYYAVRFGLILPSNVFAELFGVEGGYLGLRWTVALVATGAMFALLRRRGWAFGALAVAMLLLSPTFIRAVMTVYSTTVGVPAVAAAAALILIQGSPRTVAAARFGAGVALGFAVNANVFALLPITFMLGAWFLFRVRDDRRAAVVDAAGIVTGAVAVTMIGIALYGFKFGDPNIFRPSFSAADQLSSGASPDKEPTIGWLDFRPEIWLAPISSAVAGIALKRAARVKHWWEWAIATMPGAMWAGYLIHEFVLGSNTLEIYFYSSYLIGPSVMAIATAVAVLDESSTRLPRAARSIALVTVLAGPVVWTHLARGLAIWTINGVVPLALAAVATAWFARRSMALRCTATALVCVLPLALAVGTPRGVPLADGQRARQEAQYGSVFFRYDDISLDLYALAADFNASVPRRSLSPGSVVFWSPSTDYGAGLMQWTYLGPYSSLTVGGSPAMPELDDDSIDRLTFRTPRFLVLLATVEQPVLDGMRAIEALGLPIVGTTTARFERGPYRLYMTRFEFVPDECDDDIVGDPVFWTKLDACSLT